MKVLVVSSSQRPDSQSAKVAQFIASSASQFETVEHIDLQGLKLNYWDGDDDSPANQDDVVWRDIHHASVAADAFILITPEWGGMATPILKSYLMRLNSEDVAHKPALLISVVNGVSGAYPIAELRMNAFRNNKIVPIPDHMIIREVELVLNHRKPENSRDHRLRTRISFSLNSLFDYAFALKNMGKQREQQPHQYRYGM
ncbi:NADPH-dependent oxidoreductase [Alginatibacterium sediminis]|uniref:NADPH-dependent oxidoreductase n=1 Tax=Alginatibacterium sediminis TaxID=2164068 RepID=A0A420E8I6_9ALTE|nr:NAD(P)H-dependent oxidoreductase [Alginatibacterium sediminis]RKF14503.1 NADPH-dependent oxidoreductase [Alginatibacterium sediminis]